MSIGLTAVWHRVLGNEADDLSKLETEGVMFLELRGPSLRVLHWKIGLLCTLPCRGASDLAGLRSLSMLPQLRRLQLKVHETFGSGLGSSFERVDKNSSGCVFASTTEQCEDTRRPSEVAETWRSCLPSS